MDENNISDLESDKPKESRSKILLLGDFDPAGERIIRDPYLASFSGMLTSYLITLYLLGFWL